MGNPIGRKAPLFLVLPICVVECAERLDPEAAERAIVGDLDLLEDGYDVRTVPELLDHRRVKTTMIYTHVINKGGLTMPIPANFLL